jgi:16S rRNA (cytosine1402-N4)-methyltransferase
MMYHQPVMLHESVAGLNIKPNGCYVDVTFGGGGHSNEILKHINTGKLVAFDQDADAINNIPKDNRLVFVQHNFRYMKNFLHYHQINEVDGILADLGVSSHQFDEASRGFAFRTDAELDMRMNQQSKKSAKNVLNEYPEEKLADVFFYYGEIQNARRLASIIVRTRQNVPFKAINQLVEAVKPCIPLHSENKYLAQVFQAIRIEVNGELENLKELLSQSVQCTRIGGRLVVITYHSLEDRIVKNFIKTGNFEGKENKDFFGNKKTPFKAVNKNVIVPSEEELKTNNRARSAKLRIAERIG